MFAADLDSDGDLEVVSSAGECVIGRCVREIVWYENIDERGTFGPQKLIQDDDGYVEPVGVADVDGDGDFDILTRHTDGIGWYQNTDGFGQFSEPHIIFAARGDVQSVADVDGDGDLDLLSRLRLERRGMGWLENIDGKGTFSEPHMIVTTTTNIGEFFLDPRSMTFADVDGDRDMDVVWSGRECERVASNSSSCFSTVFAWHENTDGRGNFGPQFIIPNVLVSGNAESLQVADVDGDGDMDIVSDRTWHVNTDGSGHFGPRRWFRDASFLPKRGADVDGDGDVDFLSQGRDPEDQCCRKTLVWHENSDGNGTFSEQEPHIIAAVGEEDGRFSTPVPADLDGDGDVDVLATVEECVETGCGSNITWYENLSGELAAGDANGDLKFDQLDLVQVLQSGKYLTGQPATFEQGDWNRDGVFDLLDILAAVRTGNYLRGAR